MKSLIVFFIAAMIAGCSGPAKDGAGVTDSTNVVPAGTQTNEQFQQFVALLPRVSLPYNVSCDACCEHPAFDHENALVKKYVPEGANPIGLFLDDGKHVGILATYAGDVLILSAIIYDMTGQKLSDRNFMTGYCGRDYDYLNLQHIAINADHTFIAVDTSYQFKMDPDTDEIVDTVKMEVTKTDFYISEEGKITAK